MTRIARLVRAPQLAAPVGGAPRRCLLQSLRPAVLGALALLMCGAPMVAGAAESKPAVCVDTTPHTIRFVTVAPGVELEVLDWGGSGAPMVLLTGLGDNAHVFDQFAFQFTNFFRVIGITRRGYLPSSQPATGYDLPTRAADDIAVLDALGIDKAVFVGHSVAGGELSALGQSYPARVDKLVYLDAYDLSEQPSRTPPLPRGTEADFASLWTLQAYTARTAGNREPNPAVCHRWMFDANGTIAGDTTPDFIPAAIVEGAKAPPVQWARIEAPRLGIFAQNTLRAKQPWYWYLSDAQKKEFNRVWRPNVTWNHTTIRKFARRNSANTVRLPGAPHYIYIQNEAEVVRSMRIFLGIL
jgi:pimeloyl-ACP methyl ester carboxylesterase